MKRILVFGMTENPGGVENFLMTYYRRIDRSAIQFDFLCNTHSKVAFEDELIGLGARMFHITSRRENRQPGEYRLPDRGKEGRDPEENYPQPQFGQHGRHDPAGPSRREQDSDREVRDRPLGLFGHSGPVVLQEAAAGQGGHRFQCNRRGIKAV